MSDARSSSGFLRKTLPQLIDMAKTDIEASLPGATARLPQTNLDALAHMTAGAADEQLSGVDYYSEQIFITTADGWSLERHGAEWGILKREATRATGVMAALVVSAPTTIPARTLFQTRERVRVRTTVALLAPGTGTFNIPMEALDTGPTGNLVAGTRLDTISPVVGVQGGVVIAPGFAGGNPAEGQEPYRGRILQRIQEPPMGGAARGAIGQCPVLARLRNTDRVW